MTSILQRECVEPGVALPEELEKEDYLLPLKVRYLSTKYLNNIHLFFQFIACIIVTITAFVLCDKETQILNIRKIYIDKCIDLHLPVFYYIKSLNMN